MYDITRSQGAGSLEVPFLNLTAPRLEIQEELEAAFRGVLESGW